MKAAVIGGAIRLGESSERREQHSKLYNHNPFKMNVLIFPAWALPRLLENITDHMGRVIEPMQNGEPDSDERITAYFGRMR